jgi:hypothetical protein
MFRKYSKKEDYDKELEDAISDMFSLYRYSATKSLFSREYFMKSIDNITDNDSKPLDRVLSVFAAILGFAGYAKNVLTSLPYGEKRNRKKHETQLMISTFKNERQPPHIKVTSPFKGTDIIFDYAVEVLSKRDEKQKLAMFRTAQILEMISQAYDFKKDIENGNPNIFDPRIAYGVRKELRRWDRIEASVRKHNSQEDLKRFGQESYGDDYKTAIGLESMITRKRYVSQENLSKYVGKTLEEIWDEKMKDMRL